MDEISKKIEELLQEFKVNKISTVDFANELSSLFQKVKGLEQDIKNKTIQIETLTKEKTKAESDLTSYKSEFVTPKKELDAQKITLEYEHKDWKLEKQYMDKETRNLKEIISYLCLGKSVSSSTGNGGYYNESSIKPNLT